jgi:hypothetical protein
MVPAKKKVFLNRFLFYIYMQVSTMMILLVILLSCGLEMGIEGLSR